MRTWTCRCGATLDRDYNAAVNVMLAAGLAERLNAHGGDVRRVLALAGPDEVGTRL
ncbi:zinc ribbon domain-containing protein, partial [Prescottella equi]